jgi:putative phosphoesterase
MKVAIVSDSHGRREAVLAALAEVRARQVDTVIHCGDIGDAATVELFNGLHAHFVHGNCDTDRAALRAAAEAIGATWHGDWGCLEMDGKKLAFLHGDDLSRFAELEASEAFDFLFHGHSHVARDIRSGSTRIINPGALHRARPKTFVILDLPSGFAESIIVG